MSKLRRVTLYIMIPVALVVALEGIIYYSGAGLSGLKLALCTLQNLIKTFLANPIISAFMAFNSIGDNYNPFMKGISVLYGVGVIVAPILTTTAIISGFQAYILDFIESIRITSKKDIYIIGDGTKATASAIKYAKDYHVHWFMPPKTSDEKRMPYLKKRIDATSVDYNNIIHSLKNSNAEKSECIILDMVDWYENYKVVADTSDYLVKNVTDRSVPVYLLEPPAVFADSYDNYINGLCKKYGKPDSAMNVNYVFVSRNNAKKFFKNSQLTPIENGKHHIIFVGLDTYGTAMYFELTKYMIDNSISGTIYVFDENIDRAIYDIAYSKETAERKSYTKQIDPAQNAVVSGIFNNGEVKIQSNFYNYSVFDVELGTLLNKIDEKNKLTESFFCIDNIKAFWEYYRMLTTYYFQDGNGRMFFRETAELSKTFDALEINSPLFRRLPDDLPDFSLGE